MLTWTCTPLSQLTAAQWHACLMLRCAVFVVEQACPYLDPDALDVDSLHVRGLSPAGELLAYARINPPGLRYTTPSIGRVVVAKSARGQKLGYKLMQHTMGFTQQQYGPCDMTISAQSHLQAFYNTLGFIAEGNEYLEDDIPHIQMRYPMA